MAAETGTTERSHRRVRVDPADEAALVVEQSGERFDVYDISMAGLAFVVSADRRPPGIAVGRALPRVLVRFAGTTVHAEVVPTHLTPVTGAALLVGARLYPATESDHDALTRLVIGLENREGSQAMTA